MTKVCGCTLRYEDCCGKRQMMTGGRIVFAPTQKELEEKYDEAWRQAIKSGLLNAMRGTDLKLSLREFFPAPKPVPLDLDGVHEV